MATRITTIFVNWSPQIPLYIYSWQNDKAVFSSFQSKSLTAFLDYNQNKMSLVDKVISILTIPDQNTNGSIDANSTDAYSKWAEGDGQYLLPLILVMVLVFCCHCAILQITVFMIFLCVRKLLGSDEEEEEFKDSRRGSNSSRRGEVDSEKSMGSDAASSTLPEDGTPRSRKSAISSPTNSV